MDLAHVSFAGVEPTRPPTPRLPVVEDDCPHANPPGETVPAGRIDPVATWLLQYAGVDPSAYRVEPLRRRMAACLRQLRVSTVPAGWAALIRSPEAVPAAIDTLLIGVSTFFRDAAVFSYLEREAIPHLLRTRKGLRVLSAGSSTGEELYSVAMILHGLAALEGSRLLGIDCRARAVANARAGVFHESAMANLPAARRDAYFRRCGDRWLVVDSLRSHIDWRRGDILSFHDDDGQRDLVLFRNVAIYLSADAAARAWLRLSAMLSHGGYLVTGKAEHPPKTLPLVRVAPSVYRRL